MMSELNFLDLFAGAGGLSEGFVQAGFRPVAHIEADKAASYTLRTRAAYHWLKVQGRLEYYEKYLKGEVSRAELYRQVPAEVVDSVINEEIGEKTLKLLFERVDSCLNGSRLDLIVGGPPCQAYSVVGRSRDQNRMKGDQRNFLYKYYAEFLGRYKPSYFVFENVIGLLSAKDVDGTSYFAKMRELFFEYGYETEYKILSAENHGVLQGRRRVILVGRRGKNVGFYPTPDEWYPDVQVSEVFNDLPFLRAGEGSPGPCLIDKSYGTWLFKAGIKNNELPITWHQARPHNKQDLEIYRIAVSIWNENRERLDYSSLPERLKTHRHRNSFLDRFKVVAADLPFSHTVVAHIAKDGHYYIHPDIEQNRSITPREAARLQTFPDDYFFEGCTETPGRTPAFRQIGNAVPVLLARKIAEKLLEVWR